MQFIRSRLALSSLCWAILPEHHSQRSATLARSRYHRLTDWLEQPPAHLGSCALGSFSYIERLCVTELRAGGPGPLQKYYDIYGHEVGDRVLIAVSEVLCNSVRENDLVARWGGEEFLLVLTDGTGRGSSMHR